MMDALTHRLQELAHLECREAVSGKLGEIVLACELRSRAARGGARVVALADARVLAPAAARVGVRPRAARSCCARWFVVGSVGAHFDALDLAAARRPCARVARARSRPRRAAARVRARAASRARDAP